MDIFYKLNTKLWETSHLSKPSKQFQKCNFLNIDAPDDDDHGPNLIRDPDLDTDPNFNPDDDVFNSINCKKKYCGNVLCDYLNYGIVEVSDNEDLKDVKICTNYREWRKCPQHEHHPTKDCILRYLFPR